MLDTLQGGANKHVVVGLIGGLDGGVNTAPGGEAGLIAFAARTTGELVAAITAKQQVGMGIEWRGQHKAAAKVAPLPIDGRRRAVAERLDAPSVEQQPGLVKWRVAWAMMQLTDIVQQKSALVVDVFDVHESIIGILTPRSVAIVCALS